MLPYAWVDNQAGGENKPSNHQYLLSIFGTGLLDPAIQAPICSPQWIGNPALNVANLLNFLQPPPFPNVLQLSPNPFLLYNPLFPPLPVLPEIVFPVVPTTAPVTVPAVVPKTFHHRRPTPYNNKSKVRNVILPAKQAGAIDIDEFLSQGYHSALEKIYGYIQGNSLKHTAVAAMASIPSSIKKIFKSVRSGDVSNDQRPNVPDDDTKKLVFWYLACTTFPFSLPGHMYLVGNREDKYEFKDELKTKHKKRYKPREMMAKSLPPIAAQNRLDIPYELYNSFKGLHLSEH